MKVIETHMRGRAVWWIVVFVCGAVWSCSNAPEISNEALTRRCGVDLYGACVELGNRLDFGSYGTELDKGRAVALFERACDGGHSEACGRLASARKRGPFRSELEGLDFVTTKAQFAITARRRACQLKAPQERSPDCRVRLAGPESKLALCVRVTFDKKDPEGKAWDEGILANAPDIRVFVNRKGSIGGHRMRASGYKARSCWLGYKPEEHIQIHVSEEDLLSDEGGATFSMKVELGKKAWRGPGYEVEAEMITRARYEETWMPKGPSSLKPSCWKDLGACEADCRACEAGGKGCEAVQEQLRDGCVRYGHREHCKWLGEQLRDGGCGFEVDLLEAEEKLAEVCLRLGGLFEACEPAGALAFARRESPEAVTRASKVLGRVCTTTGDHFEGCVMLGRLHEEGRLGPAGQAAQWARARFHYRFACYGGQHEGCVELARFYEQGLGVEKDMARAAKLREIQ